MNNNSSHAVVLGANGFIGSWVCRALSFENIEVHAVVRPKSNTWRINSLNGVTIHLLESENWADFIRTSRPNFVISLDWEGVAGSSRNDPHQFSNLHRLQTVLQATSQVGALFIGTGSQAEYGARFELTNEEAFPSPTTEYGRAKLEALDLTRKFCESTATSWTWVRIYSIFGPLETGKWLLPSIAGSLSRNEPLQLSAGRQRWSYLSGPDCARAFATLCSIPEGAGVVNVGSQNAPELREHIQHFARNFEDSSSLKFANFDSNAEPLPELVPDVSKLVSLGWSELDSTDEMMKLTAEWFQGSSTIPDPFQPGKVLPRLPFID